MVLRFPIPAITALPTLVGRHNLGEKRSEKWRELGEKPARTFTNLRSEQELREVGENFHIF